ncbi:hypothetical protein [Methylobacterium pseudosasicola]|uniref:Uncharacterized protein n=1 Tax=Methylobacterium pseudosasicola TaxID=582667 RepID=A0A1I4SKW4_9HYPH|nr:hypothetical protein [Methylobacterium pseudosasicola]SFM65000.1 hypothetical protein SAMN05192568_104310 [Methylobacterium pseudosasicola]
MIHCNHRHDGEAPPALTEVALVLSRRMVPPENADLPSRLAELVAVLLARDCERGDQRPCAAIRQPDAA